MSTTDLEVAPDTSHERMPEKIPSLSFEQRAHPPPVLTLADVAAYLCLPSKDSAARFLKNHAVPRVRASGEDDQSQAGTLQD